MPSQTQLRVLCIGEDLTLLHTRCAVLVWGGYEADFSSVTGLNQALARKNYDAIVVSAMMSDAELAEIATATGSIPAVVLECLVLAPELLFRVGATINAAVPLLRVESKIR